MTAPYDDEELARRRANSRRLAWIIGSVALAIYITGFFLQR